MGWLLSNTLQPRVRLVMVGALCLVHGCLVLNEEVPEAPGRVRRDGGDEREFNFLRPDASLRPPDSLDAGGGPPDASGPVVGLDAGSSSGGADASTVGQPDAAWPGFDAGSSGGDPYACTVWQDCPPHHGDLNSAYECQSGACMCDPNGQWEPQCTAMGGYFNAFDCYCMQGGSTPPNPDPDPDDDCGWEWEYYCEEDRWVDTSHYERRCETIQGETECRDVWVQSGYYEEAGCNHVRWVWKCR